MPEHRRGTARQGQVQVTQQTELTSQDPNPLKLLQRALTALSGDGSTAWLVGPAACAVLGDRALPQFAPWRIAVTGPIAALDETLRATPIAIEALPDAGDQAVAALLAREPVRAWAVALDARGQTIDPWSNAGDARDRRLRIPGDPRTWFAQGPERVLDLAVLAARSGLTPDKELLRLARRDAGNVLSVPREAWAERFGEVLLGEHAATGLQFMHDCEILQRMVPEVCLMVDFHKSCPVHHKDIWDHTLQVVEKCPPTLAVRWAALMHDSGKVWTRSVNKQGKVHFFRHEELGASLMEGVAGRFHLDTALRDRVVYVIGNHARANVYAADWTDSAVRRLIRDMGPHLEDVLAFSSSDFTTKRQWRIAEVRSLAVELLKRIREIAAEDAKVPPLPKGLGHTIMQATGLAPGPWLGEVQRWLEAEAEAGRVAPLLEADAYLAYVQAHAPELLAVQKGNERQRLPRK